jgi:putative hemolysin
MAPSRAPSPRPTCSRPSPADADQPEAEPAAVRREDGSWLLAGWQPVEEMADLLKLGLPGRRDYHTVAGFALAQLGRFPRLGEAFEASGWRFEVVDIDGRRVDKVLAQPLRKPVTAR